MSFLLSTFYSQIHFYGVIVLRLLTACVLGGIIGYEREHTNRPAGFRTHILVCVGSGLVMVTSEFIFRKYSSAVNVDPARLGAQVISGIGFLGAGTIIREGFSVKGLTTAASLWAVSCVGIASGIGFYEGAIAATILIYITLITLKKFEEGFNKKSHYRALYVETRDIPGQLGAVSCALGSHGVSIKKIELIGDESKQNIIIKVLLHYPAGVRREDVVSELRAIDGVYKVIEE